MQGVTANEWIAAMNAYEGTGFLGFNNWRLPTSNCSTTSGYNCTDSEFGHLFYSELGGVAFSPISQPGGYPNTNPYCALFTNLIDYWYWTGTPSGIKTSIFNFADGSHSRAFDSGTVQGHAWAVLDGDVGSPVPAPPSIWLFGGGLVGILAVGNKRRPHVAKVSWEAPT